MKISKAVNIADLHRLAKRRLPRVIYDFVASGAEDETTLRRNTQIFDQYALRPRVLQGHFPVDTSITLFGQTIGIPYLIAPTGLNGIFSPKGDLALAAAAAQAGTIVSVSSASSSSLETIASHTPGLKWFQLYP